MQKLADYICLPCRIARGCKYCVADHRSSCLVKIDDKQSSRFDSFDCSCRFYLFFFRKFVLLPNKHFLRNQIDHYSFVSLPEC